MTVKWRMFWIMCVVQVIFTAAHAGYSLINAFAFLCMMMLAVLGVNVVSNNYPDIKLDDDQRSRFNKLFLLNFLLLAFSSGHVFAEIRSFTALPWYVKLSDLPLTTWLPLLFYVFVFVAHILILLGLFNLRKELYANSMRKQFSFEEKEVVR